MSTHPKPPPQAPPPVRAGGPPVLEARKRQLLALLLKEEGIEPARWPILPLPRDLPSYPLSYEQERLWAGGHGGPGGAAEDPRLHLLLTGPLRREVLERALSEVVRRHATLRTTYGAAGGAPVQRVSPAAPVPVPLIDLEGLPPERREAEQRRVAAAEAALPFDLARGPVLRARLLRRAGAEEHALLVTVHPIAADGWSKGVLLHELAELYTAQLAGRPPLLPELPVQYVDFADWQRRTLCGEAAEEALAYWRRQLAGSRALDLPVDLPRPAGRGTAGGMVSASLPGDLTAALKERSREVGVTLFTLLAAVWQSLLFRYAGRSGFNVGTPAANRYRAELEPLIGRFVNTLVLRADLSGDPPFRELLGRVKKTVADAFAHQQVPFWLVAEAVEPERGLSRPRAPLFEVMISFFHAAAYGLEEPRKVNGNAGDVDGIGPLAFSPLESEREPSSLDLHLSLVESSRGIAASLEYRSGLFDRTTVRRILEHFAELLRGAAAAPETRISELPLLTAPERAQLLAEWNDTAPAVSPDVCLHDLVAEHAERTPDAPAAELNGEVMPYWELHDRAELLATALHGLGVGPEVRVAVCLPRTFDLPLALLGVLRAGGACVPLDPGHPAERLRSLLEDSGAAVIVTQEPLLDRLPETGARRLFLEAGEVRVTLPWSAGSPAPVRPGNLAYLAYNSTRTAVEHRLAVALVRRAAESLPRDRVDAVPASGISGIEMLVTLGLGGKVVLDGEAPALLSEAERHQAFAEHCGAPPEAAGLCLHEVFQRQAARTPGALAVACEGRVLTYGELARQSQRLARRLAVRGVGPETRVALCAGRRPELIVGLLGILQAGASCVPVDPAAPARHLAGVLADAGAPVVLAERRFADRIPGERWLEVWPLDDLNDLGGVEEEGSETQMLLPRHGMRGAATSPRNAAGVFYALGGPGGVVVEHRQALACVRGVAGRLGLAPGASFALAQPLTELSCNAVVFPALLHGGLLHLIPEEQALDPRRLAEALRGLRVDVSGFPPLDRPLPGAQAYILDRAGAPVPLRVTGELLLGGSVVPRGYLGRPDLTAERFVPDPFGEAPGGRLYRTGDRARFLADGRFERCDARPPAAPPLVPVPRGDRDGRPLPLSFGQQRLWFLDRLAPGTPLYNVPLALPLAAETRREVLAASCGEIIRRHEVLRTTFPERDGEPYQEIHSVIPSSRWPLPLVDLTALPEAERGAEARRLADAAAREPFDLSRGPLLRVRLLRLRTESEPGHLLVGALHHIVSDGWSRAVFRREIEALYTAFAEGRPSPLPELPVQYADVAVWQRRWLQGEVLECEVEHWRQALAGIPPVLELPADRPRPPVRSQRGAVLPLRLAADLAEEVRAFSRRAGATVLMTLLAAFQALLGRLSGADRLAVGTPVANRNRVETEGLIGFFVNTLVLPCDLSGDPPFGGLVARAREAALTAYDHQDVPFEKLVEALAPERSLAHTPLFQVMLSLQRPWIEGEDLDFDDDPAAGLDSDLDAGAPAGMARTDLTLTLREGSGPMAGSLNYNTDIFERETVLQFWENLESLLQAAVADPQRPLSDLPLLSGAERRVITREPRPHPEVSTAYVPPATPTEQKLAEIWAGLLGIERIGLHDNFFARGGHSLLAIRLMAQIRSRLGQEVPVAALFLHPTLEDLARSLDERRAAAASSSTPAPPVALEMQPKGTAKVGTKGTKLPFFCVHPVGGGISCYAELARWMGPERPFLGLPAPPSADLKGFAGLEELAAHHLRALREVQPEGPYLLGGWSMGGLLALEMAHQLRAAGQRVELLCLFDPSPPRRAGAAPESEAELALGFARDLAGLYGVRLPADAADLKGQPAREGMEKLFGRWRKAGLVPEDLSFDDLWERFEVYRWNVAAVYRYTPRPYAGTIALFPAEKPRGKGGGGPDLLAAWRPMAASALEVLHVPGDHYTLLREPCVKALAHSLRSRLNRT